MFWPIISKETYISTSSAWDRGRGGQNVEGACRLKAWGGEERGVLKFIRKNIEFLKQSSGSSQNWSPKGVWDGSSWGFSKIQEEKPESFPPIVSLAPRLHGAGDESKSIKQMWLWELTTEGRKPGVENQPSWIPQEAAWSQTPLPKDTHIRGRLPGRCVEVFYISASAPSPYTHKYPIRGTNDQQRSKIIVGTKWDKMCRISNPVGTGVAIDTIVIPRERSKGPEGKNQAETGKLETRNNSKPIPNHPPLLTSRTWAFGSQRMPWMKGYRDLNSRPASATN